MDNFPEYLNQMGVGWMSGLGLWFFPLILWSLVWKGMALWRAARQGSKGWFIALLIINTVGILEILYLYVFSKEKRTSGSQQTNP